MWLARVYVTLKKGILDPQGATLERALGSLGYKNISQVRVGKYMEITLEEPDRDKAQDQVDEMCRRLLANPVIEDYSFFLEEKAGVQGKKGWQDAEGTADQERRRQ